MQQVGGALGLSLLGTVATQTITSTTAELRSAAAQAGGSSLSSAEQQAQQLLAFHQIFTQGATDAFLLGAGLMIVASAVTWVFLNVKHQELATDGPEAPVHVG